MGKVKNIRLSNNVRVRNKQRIDSVREAIIGKPCVICGETMVRRVDSKGHIERNRSFYGRKTCASDNPRKFSECRKKLFALLNKSGKIGHQKHGLFKDDKSCIKCGKKLCAANVSKTGQCYKCFSEKNKRPVRYCVRCNKLLSPQRDAKTLYCYACLVKSGFYHNHSPNSHILNKHD